MKQVGAEGLFVLADRIPIWCSEHLGWDSGSHRLQQLKLPALRQAGRSQLGSVEIARYARILPVEQFLVDFLEIKCEIECPPHPRVLELASADVECECLHRSSSTTRLSTTAGKP
jgi:hypothetical protein